MSSTFHFTIGTVLGRIVILFASAGCALGRDYFTEEFSGDFDLANTTFTFKPDHSSNGYAVCRLPATEFPTPTNGGAVLNINAGGALFYRTMPFFGQLYRAIALGANGTISYSVGASGFVDPAVTLSNHFSLPRISPWLGTLGTETSRPVVYQSLSNRLAFTWINVPDGAHGGSNSMQLELFFDGVIRLTYLRMDAVHGIVGLSPGEGVPADFSASNLSSLGCTGLAPYELVWSAPPSSVLPGQSFAASLSGRDAFNLDFPLHGPARLGAGWPGTIVFHTDFEQGDAGFTLTNLYSYTINPWHLSTYRGGQAGHSPSHSMYFGYNDSGLSDPPGAAGRLVSPLLDLRNVFPPVTLSFSHLQNAAGAVLEVREENQTVVSWLMEFGSTGNQWQRPSIDLSFYAGRQIRLLFRAMGPVASWENTGWLVDDITIAGTTSSIPVTPSLASFTGNSWSGNISVATPGEGLVLIAAHSNGVYGLSSPINVTVPNDLILSTEVTRPYLSLGSTGSINLVVSNTGPNISSSVVVTNPLPPGVTLGNVVVSQGFFSVAGNRLLLNFGGIGGGNYALAAFEFVPNIGGVIAFTSTVGRTESETYLENNQRVGTIIVGESSTCCDGSAPLFTSVRRVNNATVLQWTSISNRSYQLQLRPSLRGTDPWSDVGTALLAQGQTLTHTNVNVLSNGIYRVRQNP